MAAIQAFTEEYPIIADPNAELGQPAANPGYSYADDASYYLTQAGQLELEISDVFGFVGAAHFPISQPVAPAPVTETSTGWLQIPLGFDVTLLPLPAKPQPHHVDLTTDLVIQAAARQAILTDGLGRQIRQLADICQGLDHAELCQRIETLAEMFDQARHVSPAIIEQEQEQAEIAA